MICSATRPRTACGSSRSDRPRRREERARVVPRGRYKVDPFSELGSSQLQSPCAAEVTRIDREYLNLTTAQDPIRVVHPHQPARRAVDARQPDPPRRPGALHGDAGAATRQQIMPTSSQHELFTDQIRRHNGGDRYREQLRELRQMDEGRQRLSAAPIHHLRVGIAVDPIQPSDLTGRKKLSPHAATLHHAPDT